MSEIFLFGSCSLTPDSLGAMPAHLQSECAALLLERAEVQAGLGPRLANITGYSVPHLRKIAATRHAHRCTEFDSVVQEEAITAPHNRGVKRPLSPNALKLLALFHRSGGRLLLSERAIEDQAGLGRKKGRMVLRRLLERGYAIRLKPGTGPAPAEWALTEEGRSMAEQVAAAMPLTDAPSQEEAAPCCQTL